jgi:hypothetical protein
MTPQWISVALGAIGGVVAVVLWIWATGKNSGKREQMIESRLRRSSGAVAQTTEILKVDVERVKQEVEGVKQEKAEKEVLINLEKRLMDRVSYLDARLLEKVERHDNRFDDGTARMSKIGGQVTAMVDNVREETNKMKDSINEMGQRVAKIEEFQRLMGMKL